MSDSSGSEPATPRAPPPPVETEFGKSQQESQSAKAGWAEPWCPPTTASASRAHLGEDEEDESNTRLSPPPPAPPVPGEDNDIHSREASSSPVPAASPCRSEADEEASFQKPEGEVPRVAPATRNLTPSPPPGKPENSAPRPRPGAAAAEAAAEVARAEALEQKRALMRKVAQLTKVVVHLNARNDESEIRYERLRAGFEEEIRTITQDAALKAAALRKQMEDACDVEQLKVELTQQAETKAGIRAEKMMELEELRSDLVIRQQNIVEQGKCQVQRSSFELRKLEQELRTSVEAFRKTLVERRAELERSDSDIRNRRRAELEAVAAEHKRRLNDLRTAQKQEIESLKNAQGQALSHMSRLHESEMTTLKMQALQKRREKLHRLEQEFLNQRRTLELIIGNLGFEIEQQNRESSDAVSACKTTQQQIDGMQSSLQEMTSRVEAAEAEASRAQEEAARKEAEAAALQGEITVLQVRQRAAGISDAPAPPGSVGFTLPPGVAPIQPVARTEFPTRLAAADSLEPDSANRGGGGDLAEELRKAIAGAKRIEADIGDFDSALANLEDDLTEKDKQVEILEVEIEEAQLRNHQLQARILEREAAIKS